MPYSYTSSALDTILRGPLLHRYLATNSLESSGMIEGSGSMLEEFEYFGLMSTSSTSLGVPEYRMILY